MKEKTTKILIGIDEENMIVYANLNIRDNGYYSITHDTKRELLKEEEGEEKAQEYLDDGESWKMAVEGDFTTESKDDWIETVLSMDGWESVLDVEELGEYAGELYYSTWDSCGASIDDFKNDFSYIVVSDEERLLIIESDKLHLKDFSRHTKKDKVLFSKIKKLMKKYDDVEDNNSLLIEKWLENA